MSKPIIVGYDPQTSDRAPVRFAVAAARFTGAPLVVASVCAGAAARRRGDAARMEEDLAPGASGALGDVAGELEAEGIAVDYAELENTSAARALHEAAEADDAGLLVVGSTNRGAIGRVLPGSTAERLMHGAPCPIAIVPHGWEAGNGLRTIGVAYVDTDEGREALRGAHALARRAGAKLRVLTAVKAGLSAYGETEATTAVQAGKGSTEVEGELRTETEEALRRETRALADEIPLEIDAFVEDPADVLIRVSENLDLMVCGSRGYGPVRAVLLGGVSRRLAADARCPVIILPRGVKDSLEGLMAETPGTAAGQGAAFAAVHAGLLIGRRARSSASGPAELLAALPAAIADGFTAHQRTVLIALTLDGVPIDVLAERLGTTRGALYETLHDARVVGFRARLARSGLLVGGEHRSLAA